MPMPRRPGLRLVAFVVLALVATVDVAGLGAWLVRGPGQVVDPYEGRSDGVAAAVTARDGRTFLATLRNQVELRTRGERVAAQHLDGTVGGIAVAPDGGSYYAGTTLGEVVVFDARLRRRDTLDVGDAVVGLQTSRDGSLLIAHGAGAFSSDYAVDRWRAPVGTGQPVSAPAVFTISALDAYDDAAAYGTVNAQVGMLDTTSGKARWTVRVNQPVSTLLAVEERGWLIVGERSGDVELLDEAGGWLGRVDVSDDTITALGYDEGTGTILVGDNRGTVSVLDAGGQVMLRRPVAGGPIRAFGHSDSGLLVIPETGDWAVVHPATARTAGLLQAARPWWLGFNLACLLGLLAIVGLLDQRRRERVLQTARLARRGSLGYLLVLPTIALLVLFTFYPAASAFYYSFTDFSLRSVPQWIGLDNYHRLFTDDPYFRFGLGNMAIIVAASFVKTVTIPLLAAELVYWLRNRIHQYVFRTLFVLSAVVPALVLTLLWRQVYDPATGLLNQLLAAVGLEEWQRAWLGDEATALWAVIGVGFPYLTAFPFLIFLGGLLTIDRELYDAAAIDGAGRWKRFVHVDLPHLRPQFRIMSFFALVGAIEGFAGIFVLTRGGPGYATYVPALEMYERIGTGDLGYASAIGVVLFVLVLATTVFILRFRRSEIEEN